jgi:hypothetical protein
MPLIAALLLLLLLLLPIDGITRLGLGWKDGMMRKRRPVDYS